jgi:hypothetical protein
MIGARHGWARIKNEDGRSRIEDGQNIQHSTFNAQRRRNWPQEGKGRKSGEMEIGKGKLALILTLSVGEASFWPLTEMAVSHS